ncbi:hypothetical protein [Paraburkholderia caffeinilytica]|uniref:hypothetical protein n=1 Tax=Paraburkholderia caffeinilytica TaxID=1761016 RepID=UPI003DA06981
MPRPAAVTPEQICSAVRPMLSEAGDAVRPTGERFRKAVSVRKLRAWLGARDPATSALAQAEAEVARGLPDITMLAFPMAPSNGRLRFAHSGSGRGT